MCLATLFIAVSAEADVGINIPLVGRLTGGGNTLFVTAIDVSNHTTAALAADFSLDGDEGGGTSFAIDGSIGPNGEITARGAAAPVRGQSNVHFDDFVDALIRAGRLPESVRTNGFTGSVFFVFRGLNRRGQAAVTARFYNRLGDGFVGVSFKGRELTISEPQTLTAVVLDTRANTTGAPQMYPNLFINNVGLAAVGTESAGPMDLEVSAVSTTTGQPVGTTLTRLQVAPGHVTVIGDVLNALQIPPGAESALIRVRVTAGNAAIQGIVSQVDVATRDGAVFEMSRADF
jgi:hypothetical protein